MVKKEFQISILPKAYEVPSSKIYSNGWMKETGSGRGGRAAVAQAGAQPWRYP